MEGYLDNGLALFRLAADAKGLFGLLALSCARFYAAMLVLPATNDQLLMGRVRNGMVLLLGVDRFMSEARAITNTIGNAVGTVAIANWVGALDKQRMAKALDGQLPTEPEPEAAAPHPALARMEAGTPAP